MGNYLLIICAGIIQYVLMGNVMQLCKLSVLFLSLLAGTSQIEIFRKVD